MPEYTLNNVTITIGVEQLDYLLKQIIPEMTNLSYDDSLQQLRVTTSVAITSQQQQDALNLVNNLPEAWEAIQTQAEQDFANLPGWSDWTIEEAETWHNTNIHNEITASIATVNQLVADAATINNLATALPVVQGMAAEMLHMAQIMQKLSKEGREEAVGILSVRNKLWPNLQGSGQ